MWCPEMLLSHKEEVYVIYLMLREQSNSIYQSAFDVKQTTPKTTNLQPALF